MIVPVISMWQPWASWVAWRWKPIETRTHERFASLLDKTIAIHAAKHYDDGAIELARPFLSREQLREHAEFARKKRFPLGCILCTAYVAAFQVRLGRSQARSALIECDTLRSGLLLTEVRQLKEPIFCRGRQGIWKAEIPDEHFANTDPKRISTSLAVAKCADGAEGPARDGHKPLMRNREPALASPIGSTASDNFPMT